MAWLKLDDQIFYNRKVARCDTETKLLYIVGLTYCAGQRTTFAESIIDNGTRLLRQG